MRITEPVVTPTGRRTRLVAAANRVDLAAFRAIARWHAPVLDRVLPGLSHAADHGRLWAAVAAVLAGTAGRFGRRAAARGMLALGIASAVANVPAKLALRRRRPPLDLVPQVRRLARIPITWSLPSGHSASAAAFATGVALEHPRAAAGVGVLAAGVAFSRIYTGVHYPGDVLAGMAIGAAAGATTTRLWPRAPHTEDLRRQATHVPGPASEDGEGVVICVNAAAGTSVASDPVDDLARALPAARVVRTEPQDLPGALTEAAASARVLGVAGGDGSINAAAGTACDAGLPLLVVPAGTLNHLARDLGLESYEQGVRALRRGETVRVDLGAADGRVFCNAVALGSYPALVDARERLEERIGKWSAMVVGLLRVLRRDRPLRLEIDGRPRVVWMVFAGNCRYHPHGFAPGWRARLDDGLLDIRLVGAEGRFGRTRLIAAVLTGRLARCKAYEEWTATEVRIRSTAGERLRVAIDGETVDCADQMVVGKRPRALAVYVPST